MRTLLGTFLLLLLVAGCSNSLLHRKPALPALPRLVMDNFLPAVRQQVQQAYDAAVQNPTDAAANGKLGMVLHANAQREAALVCYERARQLAPRTFDWLYYTALVKLEIGQTEEAATLFEQATRLRGGYLPAWINFGDALVAAGRTAESEKAYRTVLQNDPNSAAAHYGLGRVLAARRQWKEAAGEFEAASRLVPNFGAAHYQLALAWRNLGEGDRSQAEFTLYERDKNSIPPRNDPLYSAVRELAVNASSHLRTGIELEKRGLIEQSAAEHEKALEIDPRDVQAHVNLISLYARLGQPERAERQYREAVAVDPKNAEAHYNYAVLEAMLGRKREAISAFRRALDSNPGYPEANNNLGYLLEEEGRVDEAMRHYRKAIENQPNYRLPRYHLGRILMTRGQYGEAISHLLKTLEPRDDKTPSFLYALGSAYAKSGDLENARRYLAMAREGAAAFHQDPLAQTIEHDLRRLESRR